MLKDVMLGLVGGVTAVYGSFAVFWLSYWIFRSRMFTVRFYGSIIAALALGLTIGGIFAAPWIALFTWVVHKRQQKYEREHPELYRTEWERTVFEQNRDKSRDIVY